MNDTTPSGAVPDPLLAPDEPPAFEAAAPDGDAPFLLVCDHASRRVPRALGNLGLEDALLRRHIGWDIGAAEVARELSRRFDAPLLLTGYSRLVIDCNRRLDHPTSIPPVSDGVAVPGNAHLSAAERKRRADTLFWPYHRAIAAALKRRERRGIVPGFISVHSCTPVFGGVERPWHIGVLWNKDGRIAVPLLEALRRQPGIVVGDNEPYSAREEPRGFTVAHHAEAAGYPHVALEIRQDLIDTHHGVAEWAARVAEALAPILGDGALYRREHSS
ncbi:MAG TPA: N-formylglutamate amidohydrolase [Alphaproteobacteria bacterium]|nr:N-formylglutamate amidohydrolase [Alphaproteobacteria bacterium]